MKARRSSLVLIASSLLAASACHTDWTPVTLPADVPSTPATSAGSIAFEKELIIRALDVVEDPVRTTYGDASHAAGAWTFGRLLENLVGADKAPAMAKAWVDNWGARPTINDQIVEARTRTRDKIENLWPRNADGTYDLSRAPFRLLAIVNRIDLRRLGEGNAGEGRFVFSLALPDQPTDDYATNTPDEMTVILEYKLPASKESDVRRWARDWHALGTLEGENFNAALQALTDRFAGAGHATLSQLRTNENLGDDTTWELRQFGLDPAASRFVQRPLAMTALVTKEPSDLLRRFLLDNQDAIRADAYEVPLRYSMNGVDGPLRGGVAWTLGFGWGADPDIPGDVQASFRLNTCDGCHGPETGTRFLHIAPRAGGEVSKLSGFLVGDDVLDPAGASPGTRHFGDLRRRAESLQAVLDEGPPSAAASGKFQIYNPATARVH